MVPCQAEADIPRSGMPFKNKHGYTAVISH